MLRITLRSDVRWGNAACKLIIIETLCFLLVFTFELLITIALITIKF